MNVTCPVCKRNRVPNFQHNPNPDFSEYAHREGVRIPLIENVGIIANIDFDINLPTNADYIINPDFDPSLDYVIFDPHQPIDDNNPITIPDHENNPLMIPNPDFNPNIRFNPRFVRNPDINWNYPINPIQWLIFPEDSPVYIEIIKPAYGSNHFDCARDPHRLTIEEIRSLGILRDLKNDTISSLRNGLSEELLQQLTQQLKDQHKIIPAFTGCGTEFRMVKDVIVDKEHPRSVQFPYNIIFGKRLKQTNFSDNFRRKPRVRVHPV